LAAPSREKRSPAASRETRRLLAGGLGAAVITVVGHYVDLVIGDAFAALFGFLAGYLVAGRLFNRAAVSRHYPGEDLRAALEGDEQSPATTAPRPSFEGRFAANSPPIWIAAGRRIAVICGALALLFADRILYHVGIHGLSRKLGAVVIATAALAVGFWITRWPRLLPSGLP